MNPQRPLHSSLERYPLLNPRLAVVALSLIAIALNDAHSQDRPANGSDKAQSVASSESSKFLRLKKSGDKPLALQTALTRYRLPEKDLIVDLIGAVHIGEDSYYQQLNRQFSLYDTVLYELVAPQGTRIPAGGRQGTGGNPISMLQQSAQSMLGLESQLEKVDYQRKNLVHADLSPSQMAEKMAERGDNMFTVGLSAVTEMMRQQNKLMSDPESGLADQLQSESLFDVLGDPLKMKQIMAMQFTNTGTLEAGLGKTLNQLLIVDRNQAAMEVLKKRIAKGDRHIAIFYGAAHMPDFEQRLVQQMGARKTDQVWLDAWDLTTAGKAQNSPARTLFNLLKQLDQ